MACWVTLDELRPLLDNIGGDGVHIEMDFHNEDEVEKALRIVEEYQESADEPEAADNTIRINKTMTPDEEVMAIIDKIESGDANAASAADDKMKACLSRLLLSADRRWMSWQRKGYSFSTVLQEPPSSSISSQKRSSVGRDSKTSTGRSVEQTTCLLLLIRRL